MKPARAVVVGQLGNQGKKGIRNNKLETVESYTIDSSMDVDTDSFSLEIGDPDHDLIQLLRRDTEIRVDIYGGEDANLMLKTGFVDQAGYTERGTLTLQGRDVSSLATDSQAPPGDFRNVRPHKKIKKEANELGIKRTKLVQVDKIGKLYRDGSETYWEFWYRMARKKKMWLWCEPDGTLRMDELNYDAQPRYFFGKPTNKFKKSQGKWLAVTSVEITKSTQSRVGEIFYFGESGKKPFHVHVLDRSIKSWLRRPIKVMFDSDVASMKEAKEAAYEEIFEGKVGAVEITVTIEDPGFIIRQNTIAALNIPEAGINGRYFIVGTTISAAPGQGFVQRIRLRERQYALTRRVPDDPELAKDPGAGVISGAMGDFPLKNHPEWSQFFWRAAERWHGAFPIDKFCAMLIGICDHETGIRNVRERPNAYSGSGLVSNSPDTINNGEWFPFSPSTGGALGPSGAVTFAQYREWFSNDPGPLTGGKNVGVGPGQLTITPYKVKADKYGGKSGELDGGRWMPEWNIWTIGDIMHGHLQGLPPTDASISAALELYAGRNSPFAPGLISHVHQVIKEMLPEIQKSVDEAQSSQIAAGDTINIPGGPSINMPGNMPAVVQRAINIGMKQLGKPYEWGAAGPSTFDCSGLLVYCYRVASNGSINLPHFTGSMWDQYPAVSRNRILPGDGVFFKPDLGHMMMYIGDGQCLNAPQTGDVVKITALASRDDYRGARRFVDWPGADLSGTGL